MLVIMCLASFALCDDIQLHEFSEKMHNLILKHKTLI